MSRDDHAYLLHIIDAINQIETYLAGIAYDDFLTSRMHQDAVIRQLEILGEATKNISMDTRDRNPDIPWKDMAGMRDILIHQYFGVDMGSVWDSANTDIPTIKPLLKELVQTY
ncbi:DUF86 domain-containing protein [Pelovirga terrestris]|uniref:DUF86 domain-containing protein n=1 Tax=Pelovirga terrestris TaxID=2771352 RepID=A0A8J6QZF5_9BACT|nr:DUF86 domain-containing protein [Pelovirga terrestris]MBD1401277.1 DUF86 domain-containing protein [Pelovirga terrestris]